MTPSLCVHSSPFPPIPHRPPPSRWGRRTHARTAHAVHLHPAVSRNYSGFEFSLSGSVGPFASLMIALHAV